MKSRLPKVLVAVLILGAAGGGAWWWWHVSHRQQHTGRLTLYGNVDIRQVQLAFNDSERIADMRAQEGDRVKKGELLATLQAARLQDAVRRAQAQAEAQRQTVARLEAGSRPQEIRKARADVAAAQAQAHYAELTARRMTRLAARHLVSQSQADDARAAAKATRAQLDATRETLNLALAGPRKEDIAAAKATLQADEAQLALARRELADASLYAPSDGIVQDRILEPGDMASPQQPVYTLAFTNPVWVRAYIPEPELGRIHPGMAAEVSTDTYPDKRYRGWVGYISPTAEFTPKAVETTEVRTDLVYQVRVYVCNPHNELRLGMPATVTIRVPQTETASPSSGPAHCQGS